MIPDISHISMRMIAAGSFSASISNDNGELYLWGTGSFGEFLSPFKVKTVQGPTLYVSIGNQYGCAVSK